MSPLSDASDPCLRGSWSGEKLYENACIGACGQEEDRLAPHERHLARPFAATDEETRALAREALVPRATSKGLEAAEEGRGSRPPNQEEHARPPDDRAEVAEGVGPGLRLRRPGEPAPPATGHARPLSLCERLPASRLRDVLPAGGVPVPLPPHARVQCPPSSGVPLHGHAAVAGREAGEAAGPRADRDPAKDGRPGPRDPEILGPDALDRSVPPRDDRGPPRPRRGRRLDARLHHDPPEPSVRRVRPLAVPSP